MYVCMIHSHASGNTFDLFSQLLPRDGQTGPSPARLRLPSCPVQSVNLAPRVVFDFLRYLMMSIRQTGFSIDYSELPTATIKQVEPAPYFSYGESPT